MNQEPTPQAQMNINIDPSVKPIWADEVMITRMLKEHKVEKGKPEREGNLSLIFLDGFTRSAVARITLSTHTARAFANLLLRNVEDLEKELVGKGPAPAPVVQATSSRSSYIG